MVQALIAILTSLPTLLKLVGKFIELYEDHVEVKKSKLLQTADEDVTKFVTRAVANKRLRDLTDDGVSKANETSTSGTCGCDGTGVCVRCLENGK